MTSFSKNIRFPKSKAQMGTLFSLYRQNNINIFFTWLSRSFKLEHYSLDFFLQICLSLYFIHALILTGLGQSRRGGLVERRGGVEDGAVPLCRHHGARAALAVGRHLAALGGQHPQLEGVHLHPGAHTAPTLQPMKPPPTSALRLFPVLPRLRLKLFPAFKCR